MDIRKAWATRGKRLGSFTLFAPLLGLACDATPNRTEATQDAPPLEVIRAHAGPTTPADATNETASTSTPVLPKIALPTDARRVSTPDHGCGTDAVRVAGDYCPSVLQTCTEYHPEYLRRPNDPTVSDRCLRYAAPSKCVAERKPLDFCMDRFEYPNRPGELPRVLTSWLDAEKLCAREGKRLCTEEEFNFACEGPEMLPYATGYERDATRCNFDRDYRRPDMTKRLKPYDECPSDPFCKSELERLDQRHAIGQRLSCVSWAGVVDLNGNVNEWVRVPGAKPPTRSGLKGGWWGPVRDRCRPTVRFHKENDYGYEAGFRCCSDSADGDAASEPPTTARPTP